MSCHLTDRCSGHCCRAFTLPLTPEELARAADISRRVREGELVEDDGSSVYLASLTPDIEQIAAMVVPTDRREETIDGVDLDAGSESWGRVHKPSWYACTNHDAATGDCRIYDTRPSMCRLHPYGVRCPFKACTWKAAVELEENPQKHDAPPSEPDGASC